MEETVGINLELPIKFSIELDRKLLDLRESGVKKTKAQYIIELAQIAFLSKKANAEIK
jgi:3-methyladenine DNA glycosylase/8-oxoguanine DNA glycosylase